MSANRLKHFSTLVSVGRMKAFQISSYGGPEVLKYVEVAKPICGANEVLVKVKAIGINPVETYFRSAHPKYALKPLPCVLGTDFAGIVEETSPEAASKFPPGTNVWGLVRSPGTGAYSEYLSAKIGVDVIQPLPENSSYTQGAAMGIPYFTAYRALFIKGKLQPGQTVVAHGGSGGVGLAVCSIASSYGCTVYATVGTKVGEANAKAAGAKYVYYHNEEGYASELKNHADKNSGGVDVIIESSAHITINNSIQILKKGGVIVMVGCRNGLNTELDNLLQKEGTITSVKCFFATYDEFNTAAENITKKMAEGAFNPKVVTYPFSELPTTHSEVMQPSQGGTQGKIVVVMD